MNKFQSEKSPNISFTDILNGEKALKVYEYQLSIEEMKKHILQQKLHQKKKSLDFLKLEVKKLKMEKEKNKNHISLLEKENIFLHDMIDYSFKNQM